MEATEPKINIEFEDLPDKNDAEFSNLVQRESRLEAKIRTHLESM